MISKVNGAKSDYDDTETFNISYDGIKQLKWYEHILLSRPLKVFVAFILVAVIVPIVVYQLYYIPSGNFQLSVGSCLVPADSRLPCGPAKVAQEECHSDCCYDAQRGLCFHRLPSKFSYIMDRPWSEYLVLYPRVSTVPYKSQRSLSKLRLSISEETVTRMKITFYDGNQPPLSGKRLYNKQYSYTVSSPELNLAVKAAHGTIFNMISGPLIASDGIWEVAFKLTNGTMYGLGELPLTAGTTKMIYSNTNDFSSIPLIFAKYNGSYHGLLIDIKAPTEIMVQGENNVIVRSLTDYGLQFHLFVGPTPKAIMEETMDLLKFKWNLEYWMLGAHICGTSNKTLDDYLLSLKNLKMPYESHCGHRPIVIGSNRCEAVEEKNIQDVATGAETIKKYNKRFVPHISPYIRYNENASIPTNDKCSIFPNFELFMYHDPVTYDLYKGLDGEEVEVVYPAYDIASNHFRKRLWPFTTKFDGIFIENNWPLDKSNKSSQDPSRHLPYFSENFIAALESSPTWNMSLVDQGKKYIFKHNTYGQESISAIMSMTGQDLLPAVSSHWMNGNVIINRQNVNATWADLHKVIISAAMGGISGHWLWTTPICGDNEHFHPENQTNLCAKWYMASIYLPMVRIDANTIARDPSAFDSVTYRNRMIDALKTRLSLLPYFFHVLQTGPLLRPMFYQYPDVESLEKVNTQFNVGDDLLIVPNLHAYQSYVHVSMPPGTWYEMWGGRRINVTEGDIAVLPTLESDFLSLVRGGSIIALKEPLETAEQSRKDSPFSLIIALECTNSSNCSASNDLYLLPTLTLHFRSTHKVLSIRVTGEENLDPLCLWPDHIVLEDLASIKVYGLDSKYNNRDTHRFIEPNIYLCDLTSNDVIQVDLI